MSTSVLAAGCTTSRSFRIVAPSFEMVACPFADTMSLSIPRGPRVEETVLAMARQAAMLDSSCGVPWDVSVPSAKVHRVSNARGFAQAWSRTAQDHDRRVLQRVEASAAHSGTRHLAKHSPPCRAFVLPSLSEDGSAKAWV